MREVLPKSVKVGYNVKKKEVRFSFRWVLADTEIQLSGRIILMKHQNQPITILGVSLKAIVVISVFLALLTIVFSPIDFHSLSDHYLKLNQFTGGNEIEDLPRNTHIEATPDMIADAIKELKNEKKQEIEQPSTTANTARYYYIVELQSGGDLEASDVQISPDSVTIISQQGITTVLPRSSVTDVRRFRLPDIQQSQ